MDHWEAGAEDFNASRYWQAHEAWEIPWRALPLPEKDWLQGMIQAAAVFHLLERERPDPAARLCRRALIKLARWNEPRSLRFPTLETPGLLNLLTQLAPALEVGWALDASALWIAKARELRVKVSPP